MVCPVLGTEYEGSLPEGHPIIHDKETIQREEEVFRDPETGQLPAWIIRTHERRKLREENPHQDPDMNVHLLLNTLTKIQSRHVQEKGVVLTELFDELLLALLDLTDSEYGFIGQVMYNQNGDPYLTTYSTSDIAWSAGTKQFWFNFGRNGAGLEFTNLKTLFGHVMTTKKTVIANDPANDPRRGGLPPGHPPMRCFLGLPFFAGDELLGMAAVANRPGGYNQTLVDFLQPFLATCGNLTKSAQVAAELTKQKEYLDLAARAANIGLWIANPAKAIVHDTGVDVPELPDEPLSHPSARLNFSSECGMLFEGERKEISTTLGSFLEKIHPEDRPHFLKVWIDHLRLKKTLDVEVRIMAFSWDSFLTTGEKAHSYRHFQARGEAHWSETGEATRMAGSLVDITALVQAREAAIAALNVKTQFLATMSHELRSPLNSVLGNTTLALESDLSDEQREYLEAARTSGRFLLGLIDDVLDLSKIEANKVSLEISPFSIRKLIREVIKSHEQDAHHKGLTIIKSVAEEVGDIRVGDATRFRQVMYNLMSNAIKFTNHGTITIKVVPHSDNDEVLVSVEDTGIGIPEEKWGTIFEPFTQQDSSATRKYGGSGLGLTISKNLVRMMGGNLTVSSKLGHGSVFSFDIVLPCTDSAPNLSPSLSTVSTEKRKMGSHPSDQSEETDYFGRWGTLDQRVQSMKLEERRPSMEVPNHVKATVGYSSSLASPPLIVFDPSSPSPSPAIRKARVLLAEDNPVNQKMMEKILQKAGHDVVCAENGRLAVEAYQASRNWDIILMDIQMPEMDGLEATRVIRAWEHAKGLKPIPIFAITANAMPGDDEKCLDAGCNLYLTKPLNPSKIRIEIANVMGGTPSSVTPKKDRKEYFS